ncbi:hypothetical protein RA279_27945, partial [Pseudomonas syringae pv. tagetis]|uniref:hypothetical protein n=1 Tax=Pseudomonas syringae group genomosp. 7 TaxID=251699 RepID=UPI00376FD2A5
FCFFFFPFRPSLIFPRRGGGAGRLPWGGFCFCFVFVGFLVVFCCVVVWLCGLVFVAGCGCGGGLCWLGFVFGCGCLWFGCGLLGWVWAYGWWGVGCGVGGWVCGGCLCRGFGLGSVGF